MKYLTAYWNWVKTHPIFLVLTLLLGSVFVLPFLLPLVKKTGLPGTGALPELTPSPTSPIKMPVGQ